MDPCGRHSMKMIPLPPPPPKRGLTMLLKIEPKEYVIPKFIKYGLHRFEYSPWGLRNCARSRADRIG